MAVEAAADSWTGLYLYLLPKPQAKGVVLTWASDALGEYGGPLQPTMANYWKEEPERQVQVLLGLPLVGRALEPLQGHAARAGCSLASTACSYQSALGPVGCTASLDWVLLRAQKVLTAFGTTQGSEVPIDCSPPGPICFGATRNQQKNHRPKYFISFEMYFISFSVLFYFFAIFQVTAIVAKCNGLFCSYDFAVWQAHAFLKQSIEVILSIELKQSYCENLESVSAVLSKISWT